MECKTCDSTLDSTIDAILVEEGYFGPSECFCSINCMLGWYGRPQEALEQ